jgi:hypothetical protein
MMPEHVTFPKPAKGTALLERRSKRADLRQHERTEKHKVRLRDKTCRWPRCVCRAMNVRNEVAHLDAKGAGGDHGIRTRADRMMLLCFLAHQGETSLHSGDRKIVPLTDAGTDGCCEFYLRHPVTGTLELVATERSIGVSVERSVR